GKSHSCTKSMRVTNIKELAETGSFKCIEKVTSLKAARTVVFKRRYIWKLAGHIRVATGDRNIIETNLKTKLQKMNHRLDDLSTLSNEEFTVK
ncbi:hypothetical protein A3Q56_07524, partial [Intoshia linei]